MPAPLMPREEVVRRLSDAFRAWGYDGATLARLSQATGLGKASLYHYFPGGKEEMAAAVLGGAGEWMRDHVLEPLRGPGAPAERIEAMLAALDGFYASGRKACLLGVLALGDARSLFQDVLRRRLKTLMSAIAAALVEAGLPRDVAAARAEDAVVRLQGALVVSRGLDDNAPFRRQIRELRHDLLAPAEKTSLSHPRVRSR
jgi:AcrR family transcriptional regulator